MKIFIAIALLTTASIFAQTNEEVLAAVGEYRKASMETSARASELSSAEDAIWVFQVIAVPVATMQRLMVDYEKNHSMEEVKALATEIKASLVFTPEEQAKADKIAELLARYQNDQRVLAAQQEWMRAKGMNQD